MTADDVPALGTKAEALALTRWAVALARLRAPRTVVLAALDQARASMRDQADPNIAFALARVCLLVQTDRADDPTIDARLRAVALVVGA